MSDDTIKIKKQDLWKYSTFVLLAVVVIVLIVAFGGKGTGNVVQGTAPADTGGAVNLKAFEDTNLFPTLGPENADNVVIEFSDFQCPYCAMASGIPSWTADYAGQYGDLVNSAGNLKELAAAGEIRFVYVSMSFLGTDSVYAAQAGLCANKQDKFWEMHDAIFAASTGPQEHTGKYEKENLKLIASSISGLDANAFNNCLDNDDTLADVQKAGQLASTVATGTPTFYVNGQKMSGSWSAISAAMK